MPPPVPPSNRQMGYGPAEGGTAAATFQPRTRSHQVRVATGSALASSVCVMSPCRTLGAAGFRAEATARFGRRAEDRSEEHTSELQSPYVISYAVFCFKKKRAGH